MKEYKLLKIVYSKKYRSSFKCRYHGRHCIALKGASGRPKNVVVRLRGNELAVIPAGNLKATGKVIRLAVAS